MGAQARIVLAAAEEASAADAANVAFAEMDRLEAVLSDWRVDSEVRRLADHAARAWDEPKPVSPLLYDALERSLSISRATQGAFDVTVGPLVRLWRGVLAGGAWPSEEQLTEARSRVGYEKLTLATHRAQESQESRGPQGEGEGEVRLGAAGMQLDFGGIGKGLACDRALAVLRELGYPRSMVELGGDLALGQAPPGERGWEVHLLCAEGERVEVRFLENLGIATSGRSEQFLEHAGRRYSHILDPRTGLGLERDLCVTVFAPEASLADALASAVSVLGAKAGRRAIVQWPEVSVRIVDRARRSLFDGESLEGWTETGGRYDGNADWTVEDGAIVGRVGAEAKGGLLYTEEEFSDFIFEAEVLVDYPFDSGIFVRMLPRETQLKGAQVTIDYRPGGEVCAIYSDGFLEHNERKDLIRAGEWNHFEVRCTGSMDLEVWVNGERVTDYRLPEGAAGYAKHGRIGIQVHGDRDDPHENAVRFRGLWIREL